MTLHVCTTSCGVPYDLAECPGIKVTSRSELARRWQDLMDINADTSAEGTASIEDVGPEPFGLMRDIASSRKKTGAEHWQLKKSLVLFNPAPVT